MNNFNLLLDKILSHEHLSQPDMSSIMEAIMTGQLSDMQIAAFMIALRMKGESIDEIASAAEVMRKFSNKVAIDSSTHLIDTCGTGGDSLQTFNVSTLSSIIAASAGAIVAKHGGRSVSSKCGSADVLESLGVNVNLGFENLSKLVNKIGIGFMFAPNYHPAMKYVAPVRKGLGVRTIFNMLGPLTNPAGAQRQVIGVFSKDLCMVFAEVLQKLGSKHVLVVHGEDGMDEISITGKTTVAELKDNQISQYEISPNDFGFKNGSMTDITVENVEESKQKILAILDGERGSARDISVLNAGAAIYVSGLAESVEKGLHLAEKLIDSGEARHKLEELIVNSHV
jgi:anthranilate phosphoribosyltransferase